MFVLSFNVRADKLFPLMSERTEQISFNVRGQRHRKKFFKSKEGFITHLAVACLARVCVRENCSSDSRSLVKDSDVSQLKPLR